MANYIEDRITQLKDKMDVNEQIIQNLSYRLMMLEKREDRDDMRSAYDDAIRIIEKIKHDPFAPRFTIAPDAAKWVHATIDDIIATLIARRNEKCR